MSDTSDTSDAYGSARFYATETSVDEFQVLDTVTQKWVTTSAGETYCAPLSGAQFTADTLNRMSPALRDQFYPTR
jgi:hypothetical protein